jgi:hypothetical protein
LSGFVYPLFELFVFIANSSGIMLRLIRCDYRSPNRKFGFLVFVNNLRPISFKMLLRVDFSRGTMALQLSKELIPSSMLQVAQKWT